MYFGINGSIIVNRLKVLPHVSVVWNANIGQRGLRSALPKVNRSNGQVSKKAKSNILAALNWMKLMSDKKFVYSKKKQRGYYFRLNFITLTLPVQPSVSDAYILEHLLQPFLLWMQRKKNCWNYVWKAEIQPKRWKERGERCIHFHITANKFIHYRDVQMKWTDLLRNNNLLGESDGSASSQVKAVINEHKILYYFSKYVAKSQEDPALRVACKVWGCNYNLSRMNCILEEENTPEYWVNSNEMLANFTTGSKLVDRATVYFNKFTRASALPPEIERQMLANYELFNSRDDGVTKYTTD